MPDKQLIQKYLQGRATETESKMVINYLASEQSDLQPLQSCFDEVAIPDLAVSKESAIQEQLLGDLRNRLYPQLAKHIPGSNWKSFVQRHWLAFTGLSAAACLLILGSIYLFLFKQPTSTSVATNVTWKTINNPDIRTRLGILPDGSQVYLSPNSSLTYASDFKTHRAVQLEGEGFFDVVSDQAHPFAVNGGGIQVKVLGTAFNLEAYKAEQTVKVSLVKGKVMVSELAGAKDSKILNAGQYLTYDKGSNNMIVDPLKIIDIREWENGYTIYNEVPVQAALERISNQFGLILKVKDPKGLTGKHISGVFKQQPLKQSLDIILFISRYKYTIEGNTLQVFPGH